MAYWYIPFTSINGSSFTIRIGGKTGSDVTLTGLAETMVTQEEDSVDIFKPVRLQSGYVRFVDTTDTVWREIIPPTAMDRPVALLNGSTIVWQGFLKPQTYNGEYLLTPQARDLPIVCQLSVLDSIDFRTFNSGPYTFAYLINFIFSNAGISFTNYYFSGGDVQSWLNKKIQWDNFWTYGEGMNGDTGLPAQESKYTSLSILQNICSYWGWSCRTAGTDIYFVCPDETFSPAYVRFTSSQFATLAAGGAPSPRNINRGVIDMADGAFANNNNEESLQQGIKNAEVSSDVNIVGTVFEVPTDEILEKIRHECTITTSHVGDDYLFLAYFTEPTSQSYTYRRWENVQIGINNSDPNSIHQRYAMYEFYTGEISKKHRYNFSGGIVFDPHDWGILWPNSALIIKTVDTFVLNNGILDITGAFFKWIADVYEVKRMGFVGNLNCRLSIGEYYWDGIAWTTNNDYFTIPVGTEDGNQASVANITCNRVLNDNSVPDYNGYGIPIDSVRTGQITLEIENISPSTAYIMIESLQMRFVRGTSVDPYKENKSNTYKARSGVEFENDASASTIFATDNGNPFGYGLVLNADNSYSTGANYAYNSGDSQEIPEQHLANRMAKFGNKIRSIYTLQYKNSTISDLSPITDIEEVGHSVFAYPLAISHEWADDVVIIKAIEIE